MPAVLPSIYHVSSSKPVTSKTNLGMDAVHHRRAIGLPNHQQHSLRGRRGLHRRIGNRLEQTRHRAVGKRRGPLGRNRTHGLTHYDSFVGKISRLDDKFLITRGSGVKYGLVSPDNGATWTEVSIGLGTKGHTYATYKGLFLVSGQHGQAAWSDDGMATFHVLTKETTTFDNGSASQLYINAAAYGNGVFVLGGGRGHTAVSSDGKTWTGERGTANSVSERIFDGPSGFIDCMLFAKGRFIALGGMDGASSKSAYSTDGVHWTQGGDPGLGNSTDSPRMAYGGGYIVAVDNLGRASYSTDGITWTQTETGFDWTPIKDVAYGAGINGAGTGRFVIVGGEGKAAYCDIEVLDE